MRLLYRFGRDVTVRTAGRSALVMAPHQDDETLGCGGTILRKTDAGTPVEVIFAFRGASSHGSMRLSAGELERRREEESVEACRRLGVPSGRVTHLRIDKGRLLDNREVVSGSVLSVVERSQPEEIYVPLGIDGHRDHRAVAQVVVELAARRCPGVRIYEYPVWFWVGPWYKTWSRHAAAAAVGRRWEFESFARRPRPLLVSTAGYLERKRRALEAHATQMTRFGGEPDWTTLADIENGAFLRSFFRSYETFFELERG